MKLTWYPAGTDDPLDEQADIMGGYWGLIGPDGEGRFNWTVVAPDGSDAAGGRADTADAAKAAVSRWDAQMVDYSTGRRRTPPDGREESCVCGHPDIAHEVRIGVCDDCDCNMFRPSR